MRIVRFGVQKPVPVNLIMLALLFSGLWMGISLRREFFPEIDPNQALISIPYPGATPEEIEESLAIKVEEKLADLTREVKEVHSTLQEGGGGITVEFHEGIDVDKGLEEIERSIDGLTDLPEESENIQVSLFEPRLPVVRVSVFGDFEEQVTKQLIQTIREDLRSLNGMGEIIISGVRDYELRVDVYRDSLIQHRISLPQIADRIESWMADLPGGTVRTRSGNIKIRTIGVTERTQAVRQIVIQADTEGRAIRLGDIAEVRDSFVDEQLIERFNGQPSASLTVVKVGAQDIVKMVEMVRAYVDACNGRAFEARGLDRLAVSMFLPQNIRDVMSSHRLQAWRLGVASKAFSSGASIETNSDLARFVEGRLDLLLRNACYGAVLVFLTLLAFLNVRSAFWVGVGLLTALMGTLLLMSVLDITLNLLTMFGLIVVIGLLVDDAIVVAENIQSHYDRGEPDLDAAVNGTNQVLWPVVATVLTSVVAFLPLTFIKGRIGDLLGALPMVVACALMMSLVESLLILPSHMGHSLARRSRREPGRLAQLIRRGEQWRDRLLYDRVLPVYCRFLSFAIHHRYQFIAVALAVLLVSVGMISGKRLGFTFLPSNDAETIIVELRMPTGTPIEKTNSIVHRIEQAAWDQDETKNFASIIGQIENLETGVVDVFAPHVAQMFIELKFVEDRDRESSMVIQSMRDELDSRLDEVDRISYSEITGKPAGADISIQVLADIAHLDTMDLAITEIKTVLAQYPDIYDIADNKDAGQIELRIHIRSEDAESLGLTQKEVASQVRGFLYGLDAHVYVAQEENIDVRVRLDEQTRRSLFEIENSWLIAPDGRAVPLSEIAEFSQESGFTTIRRVDRNRAVTITAAVDPTVSPEDVVQELIAPTQLGASGLGIAMAESPIDQIRNRYPELQIKFTGRQEQMGDAFGSLPYGFLAAMAMIFVILAFLFSSYFQPILVICVVPFSTIGMIWGHLLLGYDLTFLSLIGFVALSGIVVNDSLILVKFYNEQRESGCNVYDSLMVAGKARFRAILLTTITTVLGLTPLILEQSFQAKFLIPMAISIAGGLISATVLVLVVLPCIIQIFEDLKRGIYFLWFGQDTI